MQESSRHYAKISKAIYFLADHHKDQPSLDELAAAMGMSKYHCQRLFSDWAGISPKRFQQFLTKEYAKQQLKDTTVLDAALASGLSGSGRLHDLLVTYDNITPGEYKLGGAGLIIEYGIHPTPFGDCLLAQTARGVCKLVFMHTGLAQQQALDELQQEWPHAEIRQNQVATENQAAHIFKPTNNDNSKDNKSPLKVLLNGSNFQMQVWQALLQIPYGQCCSYQSIANHINRPKAVRAVASAVASNRIGYLIPCHRVIRNTGVIGQYRWGTERKLAMIGYEAAQLHKHEHPNPTQKCTI